VAEQYINALRRMSSAVTLDSACKLLL
jgi:hypothetical protein